MSAVQKTNDEPVRKSVLTTIILAFLYTGFGQIYLGKVRLGIVYGVFHAMVFAAVVAYVYMPGWAVHPLILVPILSMFLFEVFVITDAFLTAFRQPKEAGYSYFDKPLIKTVKICVFVLVLFVVNLHLLAAKILERTVVPVSPIRSPSMIPTLQHGDVFIMNKVFYGPEDVKRGDLMVFDYPHDKTRSFVKRVVGLPGETVAIKAGWVYINGRRLDAPPFDRRRYTNVGRFGQVGQEVKIPDGHYFVLGDNTTQSKDSRHWGFVRADDIVGVGYKNIFPFDRSGPI